MSGSTRNTAKKLKSRQACLLRKAQELHLLHNVQVLVLVYNPDKGEFVEYCSCEAQELFFKKLSSESDGLVKREILDAQKTHRKEDTVCSPLPQPYFPALPLKRRGDPGPGVVTQPTKKPANSTCSGDLTSLSTMAFTTQEETETLWREIGLGDGRERERWKEGITEEIPSSPSESSDSLSHLLDPF